MEEPLQTLKKWIAGSDNLVFFGGAGVSTESGIPDFRSADGLYSQKYDEPPERILSHSYFMRWPDKFYKFHRDKMICPGARPNGCHMALAKLEREGTLRAVITQNIAGLHQMAGSREVLELPGSRHSDYCLSCGYSRRHFADRSARGGTDQLLPRRQARSHQQDADALRRVHGPDHTRRHRKGV